MKISRWKLRPSEPSASVLVSQVVARNVHLARRERGMSQEDLAVRLRELTGSKWPRTAVSMFEGSWDNPKDRIRKFDVNQLVALAVALDMPLTWFFLDPTDDDSASSRVRCGMSDDPLPALDSAQLLEVAASLMASPPSDDHVSSERPSVGQDPLVRRLRGSGGRYAAMAMNEAFLVESGVPTERIK